MTEPTAAAPPFDIEQPSCFYLGREYDLATGQVQPDRHVMYDARDLTTHGVVVGMTGSGKTGLGVSILEEAAIDGIPCIIIDPKGDLSNLLLQFPNLEPRDFEPWLNPEDARQKKMTPADFAADLAKRWRQGLADSYQKPERVALCRESSEWRVYTPGSEAGLPLSILGGFAAPKGDVSREALNQRIDATASAVLGLTGLEADPVQSREHILLAQLLLFAWSRGRDLDLRTLIQQVQAPPMDQVGAFDVETFYPEKERLKLAVALNNILAAPSFSTWISGEPLDLARLLEGGGRPRQLIFSTAHLDDTQRMFFTALLLVEILNWTRKQPGTTSLRALVYFDEVFGYLPPHPANPPTKVPLMTLLKQARAFGVGVLLATQNPVDLDYKALSNAGTWFVGKLQTERDKARLVEGLEGVAAERGTLSDRNYLEGVISALKNRIFLLHNVHQPRPVVFQSRWALSFLRGPMSREQIASLMKPLKEKPSESAKPQAAPVAAKPVAIPVAPLERVQDQEFRQRLQQSAAAPDAKPQAAANRPELPADVRQFFLPAAPGEQPVYRPRVLACAEVAFVDRRKGLEHRRTYRLLPEPPAPGRVINWMTAGSFEEIPRDAPEPAAGWAPVPELVNSARKLKALEKAFAEYLYGNARLRLFENRKLGLVSEPQEDLLAFGQRCRDAALREAGKAYEAERQKYLPKFNALNLPMPSLSPEQRGSDGGVLGWVLAPLKLGASAVRAVAGTPPTKKQVGLEAEWKGRAAALYEKWRQVGEDHTELLLTPRKVDVQVTAFGLAWVPD
ncbi:MAG TPA: DUF87 domain-containing protein [Gemmataceae bacterium]|nr:DUF87 domain-containing protein [Gemmataceae bacterium]